MKLRTTLAVVLAVGAAAACNKKKSEEAVDKGGAMGNTPANPPPSTGGTEQTTTGAKPTEGTKPTEKPTPKSGADLAAHYIECGKKIADKKIDDFKKDCVAADFKGHHVDMDMPDSTADTLLDEFKQMSAAFPDMKMEPQVVMVSGRNILAVMLITGTNDGPLKMGPTAPEIPATHKKIGMFGFQRLTINDENKATEEWFIMDPNTMMGQLGLLPKEVGPTRPVVDKPIAGAPITLITADDAKEKANLELAKKAVEAVNTHKVPDVMAFWADDAVEADQAHHKDNKGKKEIEAATKGFFTAFPDVKLEVPTMFAAGDYVVTIGTVTGTNDGPMGPMKKTGKKVTATYAELVKIKDGKVGELWRFYNGLSMAKQLGLIPEPKPAADTGKKDEVKKDEPKKDEVKKDAPKMDAPKMDAPKKDDKMAPPPSK
jgi:steroid delta-isomerase-like uncharacterized protein